MKALILAAGYAVRLYPLTQSYPKPLLEVNKRPIIDYIVDKLEKIEELDEIIVVTNNKFISVFEKWAKGLKTSKLVSVVNDLTLTPEDKLGAIGDMAFSIKNKRIKDDLLVVGGDNLFDINLADFLSFAKHKKSYTSIGIYDIKYKAQASKYGVIKIDKTDKIVGFKEKPKNPQSTLVAMCLYYFPKVKLKLIGQYLNNKKHKSDAMGFYIDWLRKTDLVYGFVFDGKWYDIGDKSFYSKARKTFANS